jgi:hypothetical protein
MVPGLRSLDDTSVRNTPLVVLATSSGLWGLLLAPEPEALAVALGATLVFLAACSSFSALAGAAFLVGLRLDGICSGMFDLFAITFRGALQLCAYIHSHTRTYYVSNNLLFLLIRPDVVVTVTLWIVNVFVRGRTTGRPFSCTERCRAAEYNEPVSARTRAPLHFRSSRVGTTCARPGVKEGGHTEGGPTSLV